MIPGNSADEIWVDIPGCEGAYTVSDHGNVKSLERWVTGGKGKRQHVPEKLLKQTQDSYGYFVVSIKFNDGAKRVMKVHRLVLLSFVGDSPLMCCHGDGNKENNSLSNLRYGTAQDNVDDRTKHGSRVGALGEANGVSKLTCKDIPVIRDLLASQMSHGKIAKQFGVCAESIRKVSLGTTWSHV